MAQLAALSGSNGVSPAQIIVLGVAFVVVWAIPSVLVASFAEREGHPLWGWLVVALMLGWPLVLLVVLCIPDRRLTSR